MRTASAGIRGIILALVFAAFHGCPAALAQSTDYTSVVATGSKSVQLTSCFGAQGLCASGTTGNKGDRGANEWCAHSSRRRANNGQVRWLRQNPSSCACCIYQAKDGYVGSDHVAYEVIGAANREVTKYDMTISVKASPPGQKATPRKTQL